ncbi:MAG: signal recognition particle protein [Myxococcaceae bacterium]|nr:signal recognition particle protein [Myxococcaceae bacterium]
MLETVTKGFRAAKNRLAGKTEITAELVDESLRDIRVSLLEADVAFDVVKKFVARVREKAIGEVVQTTVTEKGGQKKRVAAGDWFVKICHDELEALMGPVDTSLKLKGKDQVSGVMMVGLQGSGKTTTTGKLANKLLKDGRKPLLVAADIYRPAAVDQLKVLGERLGVPVFHEPNLSPPELARRGFEVARSQKRDVVIIDTAGRLAIDEQLMEELEAIKGQVKPDNILLVCDAMIGQDSVRTAAEFDRRLDLDGVILTKLDGDARGGAALSIKEVTGKPIKFLGMGESLDRLEEFRPDGLAGRILGFGDIVGLMKDFEQVVDQKKAEEDAARLLSGTFNLKDFVGQIRMVRKMGPLKDLLEKFPMFGEMTEQLNPDDKELSKIEALYDSMTERERLRPELIQRSRMERIAKGSGRKVEDVKELLGKFTMMQQVMGTIGQNPGLLGRIPGFRQLGQLAKLKGTDMGSLMGGMGGKDAQLLQQAMGGGGMGMPMPMMPGLPAGYTPPMGQAAMARARLMGYAPPGQTGAKTQDKDKLKEKRKRERDARKKSRRR